MTCFITGLIIGTLITLALCGNTAGKKNGTHWVVFMKPNAPHEGPGAALSRTVPLDAVVRPQEE